ncbi:MAG: starch-binding protein, partial [Bacteroidales bacterium]|nr:starch-binding protein [Bacteroidales bacterium]
WWNSTKDNIINKLWLRNEQEAVKGGYDPKAHIAVAYTDTKELAFKNVVALLKISVLGTGVDKISVSAENIAGNFSYNTETGEVSKTNKDYSNRSTVTLSGTFTDGKDYYIAVLPGTYSTLTLKVNDKVFKTKATESEFKANSIYKMGTVNVVEEEKEIVMTINKQNNWKNVYIYAWDSSDNKIFGAWPGTLVEGNTVTFPKSYYKADVNYILNDGTSLLKTVDRKATLSDNFSVDLPADTPGRFIVYNCPDWGKNLYIFNNGDTSITLGYWPGASLIQHKDYAYKYCDISAFIDKDFNFVLNDGYHKTKDLWTYEGDGWVKKDGCHYYKYDSSHKVQ